MRKMALTVFTLTLAASCAVAADAAAGGLVAGAFPGGMRDKNAGDATVHVFLSRAPISKVRAWYASRDGRFTASAGNTLWNADSSDSEAGKPLGATNPAYDEVDLGHVVMTQSQVVRHLKDMTETKDAGVLLQTLEPAKASGAAGTPAKAGASGKMDRSMAAMQKQIGEANRELLGSMSPADRKIAAMSDLFEGLREEVDSGRGHHTKADLIRVYEKYKHLERAWYPTVRASNGRLESYDRWLLDRTRARLASTRKTASAPATAAIRDMSAIAKRMQAAAAAGRMDEVQALQKQLMAASQTGQAASGKAERAVTADHWKDWLAFLTDLDAHAYRTRIWINTSPRTWGM
jgi:hypothetical protein